MPPRPVEKNVTLPSLTTIIWESDASGEATILMRGLDGVAVRSELWKVSQTPVRSDWGEELG